MEILQTIWNVLTTENELLTNMVCIPFSFIEAYLYMLIFTTLFKNSTCSSLIAVYSGFILVKLAVNI